LKFVNVITVYFVHSNKWCKQWLKEIPKKVYRGLYK